MSEVKECINKLISYSFKSFFKKEGYKKSGIDFIKKENDKIKIVNFWADHSGFTISLGIFFNKINSYLIKRQMSSNPTRAAACHVQEQDIGGTTDNKRSIWWNLYFMGDLVDLRVLSKDVFDTFINYGIPWLNGCNDLEQALKYLLTGKAYSMFPPYSIPAIYLILGKKTEAIEYLINYNNECVEHFSRDDMKDYRDDLKFRGKEFNEFSEKNGLDITFQNIFNQE